MDTVEERGLPSTSAARPSRRGGRAAGGRGVALVRHGRGLLASLTAGFAVRAGVAIALLGVVLHATLSGMIEDRARSESVRAVELVAQLGIASQLTPSDFTDGLSGRSWDAMDDLIGDAIRDTSLERIELVDTDHVVVYSNDLSAVGRWQPGDQLVAAALDGRAGSKLVVDPDGVTRDRDVGSLLEVSAPIRLDVDGTPTVVGVAEMSLAYGPIERAVDADTRRLDALIVVGLLALYLVLFRLVRGASRELERRAEQNEYLAQHDQLTGLYNRTVLAERTHEALARASRHGGEIALIMIDLDGFKEVNDTLGHLAGDHLLVEVASRFGSLVRDGDTIVRLGGDEFAVLLEDTGADGAMLAAQRLLGALSEPVRVDGIELVVSGSLGIAIAPDHGTTATPLLRRADVAMYLAKESGAGVELYDEQRDPYTEGQIRLLADLRRALETGDDRLGLHFQPTIEVATGRVTGAEALLRWRHEELGAIPPDRFIALAERTDLIGPLTHHVLRRALVTVGRAMTYDPAFTVSVNISTRNLLEPDLVDRIEEALEEHGVPAANVRFELTETALMADPDRSLVVMRRLRDIGIRIAVDDFGTGYSSLSYLQRLPVDELKIDRGFIRDLSDSVGDQLIVQSTIDLARNLGLHTVAEGVEDGPTLALLQRLGCSRVQGHHIARPLASDELLRWLDAWAVRRASWDRGAA